MRLEIDKITKPGEHWAKSISREILTKFPGKDPYTTAAGISPSGVVHFGNFRDVITSFAVNEALEADGLKSRTIFSWDNFDRFRKVPNNVPEDFKQYIGLPLSQVPSPEKGFKSYADYFQKPFERAMEELGIELEYKYQTDEYKSGRYDTLIFLALQKRKEIAKILLSFMTEKGRAEAGINEVEYIENYYPISVYSEFTGKDITKILSFDGKSSITYQCIETKKISTLDLSRNRMAKLAWKIDWSMRWKIEDVVFEPGGHDHASPGSSFDVSSKIAKEIFSIDPPLLAEYKFVGIQGLGTKMSGSKGNAISPGELLDIYEPSLLKWLYMRKSPDQAFSLAFDSEIYRQYDEFDREVKGNPSPIPFKQAVALGQITQWDEKKVFRLSHDLKVDYNETSIKERLPKAKNWLEKYNSNEVIKLLESVNKKYTSTLDTKSIGQVQKLKEELIKTYDSIEDLEQLVYSIPKDSTLADKENAPAQKIFFKHIYNLLIAKNQGPRLSTFLWALDRQKVLDLLNI